MIMTGAKASTGPAAPTPSASEPQPHWNTATIAPNATPIVSRFIATPISGTSTLRKATIISRQPRPTMIAMNSGSLEIRTSAKSAAVAVAPPTWTWRSVPASACGTTRSRSSVIRSEVWTDCGEVVGTTRTVPML